MSRPLSDELGSGSGRKGEASCPPTAPGTVAIQQPPCRGTRLRRAGGTPRGRGRCRSLLRVPAGLIAARGIVVRRAEALRRFPGASRGCAIPALRRAVTARPRPLLTRPVATPCAGRPNAPTASTRWWGWPPPWHRNCSSTTDAGTLTPGPGDGNPAAQSSSPAGWPPSGSPGCSSLGSSPEEADREGCPGGGRAPPRHGRTGPSPGDPAGRLLRPLPGPLPRGSDQRGPLRLAGPGLPRHRRARAAG
jgi:hypothetical protein